MLHILQEIAIVSHPTLLHCLTMLHYYSSYIVTFLVLLHCDIINSCLPCSVDISLSSASSSRYYSRYYSSPVINQCLPPDVRTI